MCMRLLPRCAFPPCAFPRPDVTETDRLRIGSKNKMTRISRHHTSPTRSSCPPVRWFRPLPPFSPHSGSGASVSQQPLSVPRAARAQRTCAVCATSGRRANCELPHVPRTRSTAWRTEAWRGVEWCRTTCHVLPLARPVAQMKLQQERTKSAVGIGNSRGREQPCGRPGFHGGRVL